MGVIEKRAQIIKEMFPGSYHDPNKNEIIAWCPNKCNVRKRKLQINIEKNVFQCWVCGDDLKGFIFKLLNKYATHRQKSEYCDTITFGSRLELNEDTREIKISLPEDYLFIDNCKDTNLGKLTISYLEKLGVTYNEMLQNKIGVCNKGRYFNRMIFPSFDNKVNLNYFTARSIVDGEHYKKWIDCEGKKSKIIFNEFLINWNRPIILVESIKSYMKFDKYISNIVPILGSNTIHEGYRLFREIVFNSVCCVYLALDTEAKNKSIKFIENLEKYDINVKLVDLQPFNQPEELSPQEFIFRLKTAKSLSKTDILLSKLSY